MLFSKDAPIPHGGLSAKTPNVATWIVFVYKKKTVPLLKQPSQGSPDHWVTGGYIGGTYVDVDRC